MNHAEDLWLFGGRSRALKLHPQYCKGWRIKQTRLGRQCLNFSLFQFIAEHRSIVLAAAERHCIALRPDATIILRVQLNCNRSPVEDILLATASVFYYVTDQGTG